VKIAQIAPIEEVVPPRKYGGTETIVSHLTEELVRRGHEVTLFASGDSTTKANLVPLVPQAVRIVTQSIGQEKVREAWKYLAIARLSEEIEKNKFDVIHQHFGWRVTPFENSFNAPAVATCHIPLDPDYIQLIYREYKHNNYISISDAQRKPMPKLNFVGTVYNGVDLSQFTYSPKGEDYFAFLGRMSLEKGPKQAILAAKKAGVKLKMAAKIDAVDVPYFKKEIEPLIDGKQIKYVGEVGPKERDSFLGGARALLALIQWEEPFGLYFVEAMACGTPVIAVNRGSAPEVIQDRKTGFLVSKERGVDEAAAAIRKLEQIDRSACRTHVEQNFTVEKMVDGYEAVYAKLLERKKRQS